MQRTGYVQETNTYFACFSEEWIKAVKQLEKHVQPLLTDILDKVSGTFIYIVLNQLAIANSEYVGNAIGFVFFTITNGERCVML